MHMPMIEFHAVVVSSRGKKKNRGEKKNRGKKNQVVVNCLNCATT